MTNAQRNWYYRRYRKSKKGKNKKMVKRRSSYVKVPLPVTGFPDSQIVKMRYVEQVFINPTAAVFAAHQMRANSINDPNFTGAGHQPLGHDEWALMYRKYSVIQCDLKATLYPPITANVGTENYICALELDDTTSFPANPTTHMEAGRSKVKMLIGSYAGKTVPVVLKKKFIADRHFGPKKAYDEDSNRASFLANPAQQFTYHVLAAASDGATDPAQLNVLIEMEYIVRLFERVDLTQS